MSNNLHSVNLDIYHILYYNTPRKKEIKMVMKRLNKTDINKISGGLNNSEIKIPVVNLDECIACQECEKSCSCQAITFDHNGKAIINENCNGCGQCVHDCPAGAIKHS